MSNVLPSTAAAASACACRSLRRRQAANEEPTGAPSAAAYAPVRPRRTACLPTPSSTASTKSSVASGDSSRSRADTSSQVNGFTSSHDGGAATEQALPDLSELGAHPGRWASTKSTRSETVLRAR